MLYFSYGWSLCKTIISVFSEVPTAGWFVSSRLCFVWGEAGLPQLCLWRSVSQWASRTCQNSINVYLQDSTKCFFNFLKYNSFPTWHAVAVLTLWLKKVKECLAEIWQLTGDRLLSDNSSLQHRLIHIIWTNAESPVSSPSLFFYICYVFIYFILFQTNLIYFNFRTILQKKLFFSSGKMFSNLFQII